MLPHRPISARAEPSKASRSRRHIDSAGRGSLSSAAFIYHIRTVAAFVCVNIQYGFEPDPDMCAGSYRKPVILALAQGR